MSRPLVECVPNFSEGRDAATLAAITAAIAAVPGVSLLDTDPGVATHRTVVTFVAPPEAALEAAFAAIAVAAARIDMRAHSGAHPRMGATDVCPFVPVRDITLAECAALARRLAARVGAELGIPVYLYAEAATDPSRRELSVLRAGEYESLPDKLATLPPDHGPTAYSDAVARTGATVIGARPFLVAWNLNLNTRNVKKAQKIAALLREKGIYRKDAEGNIVRDADGVGIRDPGLFPRVQGIGWFIAEYDRAQISLNVFDTAAAPLHAIMEAARGLAHAEGVVVTGSELVGLVPRDALLAAGRAYLAGGGANPGAPEAEVIEAAIRGLGLRDVKPFDPGQAIVERRVAADGPLVRATVRGFTDTLASSAPAPGGGSVAALCGALATGLAAMVGQLSTGRKGLAHRDADWAALAVAAQDHREAFLAAVDADTAAFDAVMAAFALPKATDADRARRRPAIVAATRGAIAVPLDVLERAAACLPLLATAATGNPNARSDAGVAALTLRAAAEGAWLNVATNLSGLPADERPALRQRADAARDAVVTATEALLATLRAEVAGDAL